MSEGLKIAKASFAKSLKSNQEPAQLAPLDAAGRGCFDADDEKLCISLHLVNLPAHGLVYFEIFLKDHLQARAAILDFAQVPAALRQKSPVFLGTFWEPQSRVISDHYRFVFYYQAEKESAPQVLGQYDFCIRPPKDAIDSKIRAVVVTAGATATHDPLPAPAHFAPDQAVYLCMQGDLGRGTLLMVQWDRGGEGLAQSITLTKNQANLKFSLHFLPDHGWTPGNHLATVFLNDQEVGRYPFLVK